MIVSFLNTNYIPLLKLCQMPTLYNIIHFVYLYMYNFKSPLLSINNREVRSKTQEKIADYGLCPHFFHRKPNLEKCSLIWIQFTCLGLRANELTRRLRLSIVIKTPTLVQMVSLLALNVGEILYDLHHPVGSNKIQQLLACSIKGVN